MGAAKSIIQRPSKAKSLKTFKAFKNPCMDDCQNELSIQRYSIFSQQNVETGHFDVTFLFNKKELHAHSFVLWSASEVFETMLFGAWAKKEPIPITGHSIDDFKEFLTFLYLGKCNISMENVIALVDLAESYNIQLLKNKCDEFLTNMTPTPESIFKICELLKTYSLPKALDNLYEYISKNTTKLLKSQYFLETKKDVIMKIVQLECLKIKEEDLFEAIYKWAQYQHQKQEAENPVSIKELLVDILPYIHFPVMDLEFLHKNIVPKGELFSSFDELSLILSDANAFKQKKLRQPASKYPITLRKPLSRPRVFFDIKIGIIPAGRIVIELYNDIVPKTAENFRALCTGEKRKTGKPLCYKGSKFLCIHPDLYILGGDISVGGETCNESIYGGKFDDEVRREDDIAPGLLSMVNLGLSGNGSQFFIWTSADNSVNGRQVVFGQVIQGLYVVKEIQKVGSKAARDVIIANCGEL